MDLAREFDLWRELALEWELDLSRELDLESESDLSRGRTAGFAQGLRSGIAGRQSRFLREAFSIFYEACLVSAFFFSPRLV